MAIILIPDYFQFQIDSTFEIQRFQRKGGTYGGLGQTAEYADPIWSYNMKTIPVHIDEVGAYKEFFDSLEGVINSTLIYDPSKLKPAAYKYTNQTSWGAPVVTTISRVNSEIEISGLTQGTILTTGDMFSFVDDGRYHLHRMRTSVIVGVSGAVTLKISPRPSRNIVANNQSVSLFKPSCSAVMEVIPQTVVDRHQVFSVSGYQVTRSFI